MRETWKQRTGFTYPFNTNIAEESGILGKPEIARQMWMRPERKRILDQNRWKHSTREDTHGPSPTIWQLWYFVICAHCLRTDTYTHIHTPTRPFSWTIGKQVADVTLYHWPLLRIRALPHSVGITPKQIQISMISDVNWRGWITLGVEWQEDCSNTRLVRKLLC